MGITITLRNPNPLTITDDKDFQANFEMALLRIRAHHLNSIDRRESLNIGHVGSSTAIVIESAREIEMYTQMSYLILH